MLSMSFQNLFQTTPKPRKVRSKIFPAPNLSIQNFYEEHTLYHKTSFFDLKNDSDSDSSLFSDQDDSSILSIDFPPPPTTTSITTTNNILHNKPELTYQPPQYPKKAPSKASKAFAMPSFDSFDSLGSPSFTRGCKVRRTQSMFSNPQDVMTDDNLIESHSILSQVDCPIKSFTVDQDPFRRIDRDTLCDILDGHYKNLDDRHILIDCRFEYEYQGGHIEGAININSKEGLEKVLIESASNERVLLVFHCEYSAHRGPRMATHLRSLDRQVNTYPRLHYPDIAILSGGYSHFFAQHDQRCFPQKYVAMNDNKDACEREMDKFRRTMKSSKSFTTASRSQSVFTTFKFPLTDKDSILFNDPPQPARRLGVKKLVHCKLF